MGWFNTQLFSSVCLTFSTSSASRSSKSLKLTADIPRASKDYLLSLLNRWSFFVAFVVSDQQLRPTALKIRCVLADCRFDLLRKINSIFSLSVNGYNKMHLNSQQIYFFGVWSIVTRHNPNYNIVCFNVGAKEHLQTDFLDRDWLDCLIGKTMGKECMARLSRRLWGGTSLKTAAKEASG